MVRWTVGSPARRERAYPSLKAWSRGKFWVPGNEHHRDLFAGYGANVGVVTAMAPKYGHDVIAFEPNPTALAQVRTQFEGQKVQIIPKAVGGSARTATFYHFPTYTIASSLIKPPDEAGSDAIEVDVVNLVEFIRQMNRPVAGIKMDIEGAEAECLEAILDAGLHQSIGYILAESHDGISEDIRFRMAKIRDVLP